MLMFVLKVLFELLCLYQCCGVEWMYYFCDVGCYGLFVDEMGLGKMFQVILFLVMCLVKNWLSLIVCLVSVVFVWCEEIVKFFLQFVVDVLKSGYDFMIYKDDGEVVWLVSYMQLCKYCVLFDKVEFGYVVFDEGQFIKNLDVKVMQICFVVCVDYCIVFLGMLLENCQLDFWLIFCFLLLGLFGLWVSFELLFMVDCVVMLIWLWV